MIWQTMMRASTLVSIAAVVRHFYDLRTREIKPSRIYLSHEVARFLGVSRRTVIGLVKNHKIQGKLVSGNYRITGKSILEYLSE